MKSITLPDGLTSLGEKCFAYCMSLKSITLPETLKEAGGHIFESIDKIIISCLAVEPPQSTGWGEYGKIANKNCRLFVPEESVDKYKANRFWNNAYCINSLYPATSITLSQTEAILKPNDTMQLEATVYPDNATNKEIIWKSSNDKVATVTSDGLVLAKANGSAEITAETTDGSGIRVVCYITVSDEKEPLIDVIDMYFEESSVVIKSGESRKLNVIFIPANASDKQLTWTSKSPDVATVDNDGNVYGVAGGNATIVATNGDEWDLLHLFEAYCYVTVIPTTGIGNINMEDAKLVINNRHLRVEGLADNDVIQVDNIIGFTVYKGTEHEVDLKAAGTYILKVKGKALKFIVK